MLPIVNTKKNSKLVVLLTSEKVLENNLIRLFIVINKPYICFTHRIVLLPCSVNDKVEIQESPSYKNPSW